MAGKLEPLDRLTLGPFFWPGQCCNFFVVLLNAGTLHIYPYNSTRVIKKPPRSGGRGLKL